MSDESKRLLAFLLSGLILIGWMAWSAKKAPTRPASAPAVLAAPQAPGSVGIVPPSGNSATATTAPSAKTLTPIVAKTEELQNDVLAVSLSNYGGYIESAELRQFSRSLRKKNQPAPPQVEFGFARDPQHGTVQWDLLINGKPFQEARYAEVTRNGNNVAFRYRMEGEAAPAVEVTKRYTLAESGYLLGAQLEVHNTGKEPLVMATTAAMGVELGDMQRGHFNGSDPLELAAMVNEKRLHVDIAKVKNAQHAGNSIPWAGVMDRYFLAALLPTQGQPEMVRFERVGGDQVLLLSDSGQVLQQSPLASYSGERRLELAQKFNGVEGAASLAFHDDRSGTRLLTLPVREVEIKGRQLKFSEAAMKQLETARVTAQRAELRLQYPSRPLLAGERSVYAADLYLGPKDLDVLAKVGRQMDSSIDLGSWIGVIAKPMLQFMKWTYGWLHNYGLAIILLTVLVRLLLYPLTHMQFKSMQRMQALKPHMDSLREKFKDNKEELNKRMIELFRTEKVNPMGGCLPLLLQMPVFFALYRVLYNAIELRHAPFAFWLHDLAAKDPYYITPILLGLLMFVQQKMTPTAGMDPSQEMVLKIMPIMFSFFMLYLPSGLVLYILVSTLLGLVQQWYVQKHFQVAPAAVGNGNKAARAN